MEALRRLRRNSTETNVDRRLVTNVLLSFLSTPRADSKRFEMLSLLSSILSWNDQERERAGLQRVNPSEPASVGSFWSRTSTSTPRPVADVEKSDETEVHLCSLIIYRVILRFLFPQSFSRLWVEFLLTEASGGGTGDAMQTFTPPRSSISSIPGSPTVGGPSPLQDKPGTRRLSSLGSAAMASSPNLLGPPPSWKGKEKERVVSES